jgi:hypothetical protein
MPMPLVAELVKPPGRCTIMRDIQTAAPASKKRSGAKPWSAKPWSAALMLAILCSSVALAKDYEWKDAKVIDITSEKGGSVITPIAALIGVSVTKTFYWIQTDDTLYVLGPVLNKRQLLNVTMYEPTKFAMDGNNGHILDDSGTDKKLPVVEKVARPKAEDPQSLR